ncbi:MULTISPECIES: hypothetical protein [unclassified Novosphingobium]|uniref:hypothetical protein n=1 Tax=unclassified Novosphingobium TaxID=2644732 RepID=UPI000EE68245|nr:MULTISPECIES: hypothetical protein [unclassified Novosphingobium]HCF24977.1 hypothetical protein [Novosphingobium sp.]HQV03113.1 hypothetical protein [Novosphingobium sp.]
MTGPKPIASLGPRLLARKGGARPAMRPAASALAVQDQPTDHDDLGWNDMGEPHVTGEVLALHQGSDVPEVVRQQRDLARQVAAERRSALADGRRAAFTLRLDAERHLKLRLACTITGRSAQSLVTEALDRMISEVPDAAEFASKLAKKRK